MFAEEQFLSRKFGTLYIDWSRIIPAFIPSFKKYKKTDVVFSFRSVLRREYSGFLAIAISFGFIDLLRNYFVTKALKISETIIYINLFVILFSLILKILKKYSTLLNEKDRS